MIFILSSIFSCVNCPAVICLPNTILSCGETPLVNCGPRSFSLILLYNLLPIFPVFLLQTILFPFDTINPLFSARPVRLTTSLSSWGRVIWLCCAGLYSNLGVILVSFWFDKPWFHTEGNSCCCLHHHLPLGAPHCAQASRISGAIVRTKRSNTIILTLVSSAPSESCCNVRIYFHSVHSYGLSTEALFVNCPAVIC